MSSYIFIDIYKNKYYNMSNLVLYNNQLNESLKFKIDSTGVETQLLENRLVIISEKVNRIIFGEINEDNQSIFKIPKLSEFAAGDTGKIHFEIVGDGSYFKVWESEFLINSKNEIKAVLEKSTKIVERVSSTLQTITKIPVKPQPQPQAKSKPVPTIFEPLTESIETVKPEDVRTEPKTKLERLTSDIEAIQRKYRGL